MAERKHLTWSETLRRDPCAYCGGPGGTVDHIIPRQRGGSDEPENLTGACLVCNGAKNHLLDVLQTLVSVRTPRRFGARVRAGRNPRRERPVTL